MKRVAIIGCSGILGQETALTKPIDVETICFYRTRREHLPPHWIQIELESRHAISEIMEHNPDTIVNFAGNSSVDEVEAAPSKSIYLNAEFPILLAQECRLRGIEFIHISSNACATPNPVNLYGLQKEDAEIGIQTAGGDWHVLRPSFVIGHPVLSRVCRTNPLANLFRPDTPQVNDKFFSISFPEDTAATIWKLIRDGLRQRVTDIGSGRFSRYTLAKALRRAYPEVSGEDRPPPRAISSDELQGIAPRPEDTSYSLTYIESWFMKGVAKALSRAANQRDPNWGIKRIEELALFTNTSVVECVQLQSTESFQKHHDAIAKEFRAVNPISDERLLSWYRHTDKYIWELTAYHLDERFNYAGTCATIAKTIQDVGQNDVLVLGDGIGTLYIHLHNALLFPVYHDLEDSFTALFAKYRFANASIEINTRLTAAWNPWQLAPENDQFKYGAIVALDFFEHLPNVEDWVRVCHKILRPGGLFLAQNAFALGSGMKGSIPCHLQINDRFEKDWDPLLDAVGFIKKDGLRFKDVS